MTTVALEITQPPARRGKLLVHLICWLLGNGCLFTWNSMLTVMDYYILIFPHYHPARVLTLVYQPFALMTIFLCTYYEARVNTRIRIVAGFTLFFLCALSIPFIDIGSSGDGKLLPFIILCLLSGITGIADALVQGGMVGDLSFMQTDFMQSYVAGGAASGVITSALRMVTKASFKESRSGLRKGALTFFFLSATFMMACLILYAFIFPRLSIVKYYRAKAASEGSKTVNADLVAGGINITHKKLEDNEDGKGPTRLNNMELLAQTKDYAIDCLLVYILTLSIFPGFLAEDTGKHGLGAWYVVTLIAMYNCGDLVGRYIPLVDSLLIKSRALLMIVCTSRYAFVPAFYFTAKYGDQGWMLLLCILLGMSNGYLTASILMNAPKGFKGPEQNAIGNIMVLFILGGIFTGVLMDWLWLIGKGW